MPFQSRAAARSNFMSLMHGKKSSPKNFLSRVRLLDDDANRNVSAQTRHNMYREQLINDIRNAELLELILGFSNLQTLSEREKGDGQSFLENCMVGKIDTSFDQRQDELASQKLRCRVCGTMNWRISRRNRRKTNLLDK